jgi:hypothetical protein
MPEQPEQAGSDTELCNRGVTGESLLSRPSVLRSWCRMTVQR